MFKYVLDQYKDQDIFATEGFVSDTSKLVWTKIKEFCIKIADMFQSIWHKLFQKRQTLANKLEQFKSSISKTDTKAFAEKLKQSVNPSSEEYFDSSGHGCFIVPKDEMLRVLADIDKATAYINAFGDKFIMKVKQINPSGKLLRATESDLPAIEQELDSLMDEQKVREKIAADFESQCPSLKMNLNDTFVVTQDTIQVLWKIPPNKGDGTYEELGYKSEADVKQVCDIFIASVKKGYNNRDKKYIDEIYAIKNEVDKQESSSKDDPLSSRKSKLYGKIVNWLMMLKRMTIILDKEQLSLIENCYGSLSRLSTVVPTTWNWRG